MAAYLILWVKYIKKFPGEWEEYWPQAIPIATVLAVGSLVAFVVAFWPVWGWLTIPGIFVLFLGVLNLAHFVPVRARARARSRLGRASDAYMTDRRLLPMLLSSACAQV